MRLKVTISPKTGELLLPRQYMRPLSSAIWKKINVPKEKESTSPKLICFSPLIFKERSHETPKIRLKGTKGYFLVSSPIKTILEAIGNISGEIEIAGNVCNIVGIKIKDEIDFANCMVWETMTGSGMCTKKPSLIKCETFVSPKSDGNQICEKSLLNSLQTKWKELCKVDLNRAIRWCEDDEPLQWMKDNLPTIRIVKVESAKIEKIKENANSLSWTGKIEVNGHTAWQRLIWDCGLGSKTGVGNGAVEPREDAK